MHITGSEETLRFVEGIFTTHFASHDTAFLRHVFKGVEDLFAGEYQGYQTSDTAYHDFPHTCEATVAVARILDGHIKSGAGPKLKARDFELAIVAILLHDSGFIKESGDNEGTGAKYTLTHVTRSGEFATKFLPAFGVTDDEIRSVQLAIDCTGVAVDLTGLPFEDDRERFMGSVIGTGDMLGQMAAPDYPERLPGLYVEFQEAAAEADLEVWISAYTSAEDLMRKTRDFYEGYVKSMLGGQWGDVHRTLSHHFESGENHYFEWIEANIERIDRMLENSAAEPDNDKQEKKTIEADS